jgi:hypothetical protein
MREIINVQTEHPVKRPFYVSSTGDTITEYCHLRRQSKFISLPLSDCTASSFGQISAHVPCQKQLRKSKACNNRKKVSLKSQHFGSPYAAVGGNSPQRMS